MGVGKQITTEVLGGYEKIMLRVISVNERMLQIPCT